MTPRMRSFPVFSPVTFFMIKLSRVFKEYPIDGEVFTALRDVSLEITKGEFTGILGPSGSGKSTLMHIMGLLDHPTRGQVTVNGKDIARLTDDELSALRNAFVGFVFQSYNLIPKLNIMENILLPVVYAKTVPVDGYREKARKLISDFGLEGKEKSFPNKLSGGQQQRVAIARALIMNPDLVLADEPTGNLDTKTGDAILTLLTKLNRDQGVTVVIITHDQEIAKRTGRHILIRDGAIETVRL